MYQHRMALYSTVLPSYENWNAFDKKAESGFAYEIPLYTDATLGLFDVLRSGPYLFVRTHPSAAFEEPFRTIIVMRVDVYIKSDEYRWLADLEETQDNAYHGGNLDDEIAALLSLSLGVRLMKGSMTREFNPRFDARGLPHSSSIIPALRIGRQQSVISHLQRTEHIRKLPDLFITYPTLEKVDALILVKSARQYQQAIWYADSDPSLGWLMLVSAVETAAGHWGKRRSGPSTRFREFLLHFFPGPPNSRPSALGQFPFDNKDRVEHALRKIYGYRSRALHEGRPFPAPMCHPPSRYGGDGEFAEIPAGLATGVLGSTWKHEDTPMLLHTFEHIVRGALTAWWRSMVAARTGE